jgi:branched-chain amino acid transport system permease protein
MLGPIFQTYRTPILFSIMALMLALVGFMQSWGVSLTILNMCLISAIMALGVNMQWGYAGLFNVGVMGFAALGGLAGVLVSMPPVSEAWQAGGLGIGSGLVITFATVMACLAIWPRVRHSHWRYWIIFAIILTGYALLRAFFDPGVDAIESIDPSVTGYLGGLGLPIILSWPVGALFAAGVAFVIGKIALGLRSDYLAIATLGISEIIIFFIKNEEWLTRGVKNVNGLPRPVPFEVDLQQTPWFQDLAMQLGFDVTDVSSIFVKLCYAGLFLCVIAILLWLSESALKSPWGRMMRAIRDNEIAAAAMGKDVTWQHLRIFILGSAVIGMAGAMLTTLDGQFTPVGYQPLRFTFLIWVMVIIGGSGNNWGAVLGGFFIWFFWIQAEPIGLWLINTLTAGMDPTSAVKAHLLEGAAHMRLMTVGLILLVALRYAPEGLIPERKRT